MTDRPGFAEMLERLMSNGARTIIVESPDRFARDLMVQLSSTLAERGGHWLRTKAKGFSSRMRLCTVGRHSRRSVAVGLQGTRHRSAARGRFLCGKRPFGYLRDDSGELLPIEAEQEAIAQMIALKAQGRSLRAIAAAVQAQGHQISHQGVKDVLTARRSLKSASPASTACYGPHSLHRAGQCGGGVRPKYRVCPRQGARAMGAG